MKDMPSNLAVIRCPKCGRLVKIPRIYASGIGGAKKLAVRHEKHFLIIGFDRYGIVRYTDSFDILSEPSFSDVVTLTCPQCKRLIAISSDISYGKFAIDHQDHVVLIYKAGNKIEFEVIDVIEPLKGPPEVGLIRKILRNITPNELASILMFILKQPETKIFVPASIIDDVKKLIRKLFGISAPNVEIGMPRVYPNEMTLDFFINKIEHVQHLSTEEAIEILRESFELISSLCDSITKIWRLYNIDEACKYLNQLKTSSKSLYNIVLELIRIKC